MHDSVTPPPTEPITVALPSLGRYQLLRKLGEGGMGEVYLASDTQLDRLVAIKLLPAHAVNDPDAIARFQREARALARLTHPGIIQAHDSGEHEGKHFLVMEYVEGNSLAGLLKEQGKLSPARAADFIYQTASALQHAHDRGLVHRDIKPSNLLVNGKGQVKVLDLGLARFLQDQIADTARTREGVGMGTPDYASPEQFKDAHKVDHRADIYSLGCTLYHLIAGRVPFPTSSFTEKFKAHCEKEPPPLEELCPDIPGGLAVVIQKMMAKRPDERFQKAQDVVDALAPFVAGSSASFQTLRETQSWKIAPPTERAFPVVGRLPWVLSGVLSLAVLVLVLGFVAPGWFLSESEPEENRISRQEGPGSGGGTSPDPKEGEGKKPVEPPVVSGDTRDPDILTVSRSREKGGKFQTITQALEAVKKGQTIRVLDDAVYRESLHLGPQHAGVTLETWQGATLEVSTPTDLIRIGDAPDVTVRGFRLRAKGVRVTDRGANFVHVGGGCVGLVLEDLEADTDGPGSYNGVVIEGNQSPPDRPLIVRRCVFRRPNYGMHLAGLVTPIRSVRIQDNLILDARPMGIVLSGFLEDIAVVGNRLHNAGNAAVLLNRPSPTARNVRIANNSVLGGVVGVGISDCPDRAENIQVRNNLFLGVLADLVCLLDSDRGTAPRPGDIRKLRTVVQLGHNWREGSPPPRKTIFEQAWISPAPSDRQQESIPGIQRSPDDLTTFLRPAKNSPVAKGGAGLTDPSLPGYAGALPPEGGAPWDWDHAWRMPPAPRLLTVSKKPEDGGKYRTIGEALASAGPWTTIRVLDQENYAEAIQLDDPVKQAGVTLEAVNEATLQMTTTMHRLIQIRGVPHARVRGFQLRAVRARPGSWFVNVSGKVPGVTLEELDIQASHDVGAITIVTPENLNGDRPVVIQSCRIRNVAEGIKLAGHAVTGESPPAGGVQIRNNVILGAAYRGIVAEQHLSGVQIVGNVVGQCSNSCLQVEDLSEKSSRILIANNTAFESTHVMRYWVNGERVPRVPPRQVELVGNLLLDGEQATLACLVNQKESPELARQLAERWVFQRNAQSEGVKSGFQLPRSRNDVPVKAVRFLSRSLLDPDAFRPAEELPLASATDPERDPTLPPWIGAVPPQGKALWNWNITWDARKIPR